MNSNIPIEKFKRQHKTVVESVNMLSPEICKEILQEFARGSNYETGIENLLNNIYINAKKRKVICLKNAAKAYEEGKKLLIVKYLKEALSISLQEAADISRTLRNTI